MPDRRRTWLAFAAAGLLAPGCGPGSLYTDSPTPPPETTARSQQPPAGYPLPPASLLAGQSPTPEPLPLPESGDKTTPINLATALQLANARPIDVNVAGRMVEIAARQYDRAKLLWLPNIVVGVDYFHHDGLQQNFAGEIVKSSRSTFMAGVGPNLVFSFSDALYAPLAARQDLRFRQMAQQAAVNDSALAVVEAYFTVQQARGELAGAVVAEKQAEEVARRTTALAEGLAPPLEASRAKVELARRKQAVTTARERWRTASADLARLLRMQADVVFEPLEPPFLPVTLIDASFQVDHLIPVALGNRPELAGQQAVVQATLARLKQEKLRPLVPSLALRSTSTNPSGSLGYGTFGGGTGSRLNNFGSRFDIDVQVLWEFQSLGFGNLARVGERKAEHEAATLELFRTQDRIAAEVAQAFAQVQAAAERLTVAEPALKEALDLVGKNLEGLSQTRRVGDVLTLIVRPQEAVAALQALGQANADFHAAVADYNRGQFRLYRALGHPAQCLAGSIAGGEAPPPANENPRQLPDPTPTPPAKKAAAAPSSSVISPASHSSKPAEPRPAAHDLPPMPTMLPDHLRKSSFTPFPQSQLR